MTNDAPCYAGEWRQPYVEFQLAWLIRGEGKAKRVEQCVALPVVCTTNRVVQRLDERISEGVYPTDELRSAKHRQITVGRLGITSLHGSYTEPRWRESTSKNAPQRPHMKLRFQRASSRGSSFRL